MTLVEMANTAVVCLFILFMVYPKKKKQQSERVIALRNLIPERTSSTSSTASDILDKDGQKRLKHVQKKGQAERRESTTYRAAPVVEKADYSGYDAPAFARERFHLDGKKREQKRSEPKQTSPSKNFEEL